MNKDIYSLKNGMFFIGYYIGMNVFFNANKINRIVILK